jgi:hypothetical protein
MCAPSCVYWWRALGRAASSRDFVKIMGGNMRRLLEATLG